MRSGGSNDKGGIFERIICRKLSLLVSDNQRDDIYWRSAMSGGRARIQLNKGTVNETQAGDVSAIDELGYWLIRDYIIELKHYASLEISSGLLCNTGTLYRFWIKLLKDSKLFDKKPLLIARENYKPIILLSSIGKAPCTLKPILTAHQWKAEIRLFDNIERLSNDSDRIIRPTSNIKPTRRISLGNL
jgi:hypothetical protein